MTTRKKVMYDKATTENAKKMKTTMSTKVTKTMKDNDIGRETARADSWG